MDKHNANHILDIYLKFKPVCLMYLFLPHKTQVTFWFRDVYHLFSSIWVIESFENEFYFKIK